MKKNFLALLNYKYLNLTNIERTKNDVNVNSVMLISPKMMSV